MEKKLLSFHLGILNDMEAIDKILGNCYHLTSQKFSINFNGSKGYLDNIEITCEGEQISDNRIEFAMLVQTPNYNKILITIYYCKNKGVKIEVENIEKIKANFFKKLKQKHLPK